MEQWTSENMAVTPARPANRAGEGRHARLHQRVPTGKGERMISCITLFLCLSLVLTGSALAVGFSDVPEKAWYADAVRYVSENGLMNGTGGGRFLPDMETTRAMVAAVLYRNAGSPAIAGTSLPSDVSTSAWYRDAAAWALEQGVLSSVNGRFDADAPITRETLANALWVSAGKPAPGKSAVYADDARINAKIAVSWTRNAGLMNGVGGNRFDPDANTTRAVLATILQRLNALEPLEKTTMLTMKINGKAVDVAWESNESVTALRRMAETGDVTVQTSAYGGFEQVGSLGTSLPRNDVQTTTSAGDIVLYSGNQIVLFYGSNSWAYTRLGRITGMSARELRDLLGGSGATVTLSLE